MKISFKPIVSVAQVLVCIVLAFIVVDWSVARYRSQDTQDLLAALRGVGTPTHEDSSAGNSTLGFESIVALSQGTKWRVDGLRAAGQISGIQVQIPAQPGWSDGFINAFQQFGPVEARGAALAWLGHIDILKLIIMNRWSSALVLEDDMDWDVSVRAQARLIADAVRTLTRQEPNTRAPYGLSWDVLWMGHCSDPPDFEKPHIIFEDPTCISHIDYHGINRHITTVLREGQRSVHYSINPVCTFAYAVTAQGAEKVLNQALQGRGGAFDLMLLHACQEKVVNCITANPEIFNPYHTAQGNTSEVYAADHGKTADTDVGSKMGWTDNIRDSARCAALWDSKCPSIGPPQNL